MALELLGPSGSQLQAATSNLFSQRVDATLTTTGIYTIVVRTARANDTGNYGVVWERPSNPCNRTKPEATKQITGTAKVHSAESVARSLVKGLRKGRFVIAPGLEMTLLARLHSILAPLIDAYFDSIVARVQRAGS